MKDNCKIEKMGYVKPVVLDLGPTLLAHGGICVAGNTETEDCTTGGNASIECDCGAAPATGDDCCSGNSPTPY